MNDRFLVVKYIKNFVFSIENLLINLPRKELLVKNRIMNDLYDILEFIYIANLGKDKNIKINIISKLSMLDFYFERLYKLNIISEKVCMKKCRELDCISKMVYSWLKNES